MPSQNYGSQAVVVSIDLKRDLFGRVNIFNNSYKENWINFAKDAVKFGAGEIFINSVNQVNSKLLKNTTLFDIYRDKKNIGKKAYGLRFEFLHSERTLKDKEVDSVINSIQAKLEGEFNATLR